MNASLTQVDAYRETVLSGRATSQRERILAFVRWYGRPVSRQTICDGFQDFGMGSFDFGPPIPLASVCGRVNVLVKSGLLRELKGAGKGPMGDPVNLVVAVEPEPVQKRFSSADFSPGEVG